MLAKPSAPFSVVPVNGESVTLDVEGKVLVLPTGNAGILIGYNEYTIGRSDYTEGTHSFTFDADEDTGLLNIIYPWIVIFDPAANTADFFLTTDRFNILSIVVNSSNVITSLSIGVRNGLLYHGQINYPDLTLDSNSNNIPNFLEPAVQGSITKFLQSFDFHSVLYASSDCYLYTSSNGYVYEGSR